MVTTGATRRAKFQSNRQQQQTKIAPEHFLEDFRLVSETVFSLHY